MRFGVAMRVRYDRMRDLACLAEELGFESVWLPEHLVWPAALTAGDSPYGDRPHTVDVTTPTLDVLVWMATLAVATERIRLGTYVYNLALRHPFVAARAVQTLDVVSGGRVELGVGAGWSRGEYDATGVAFASRGRRLDEAIDVVRLLWTAERPEHHGEFFDFPAVVFEPKPAQGRVPVLVGGESAAALRRAAGRGDGWIGMAHSPATAAEQVRRLRQECARRGREPAEVTVTVGGAAQSPDDVAAYADAGVDRLVVAPWRLGADAPDALRRFAAQVATPGAEGG